MGLPEIKRLDELGAIDRNLVYVFLAGPGQGEGVVVHAPQGAWIALDGCGTAKKAEGSAFPLQAILRRWAPEVTLELLVLTHPHRDHARGIPEVIDEFRPRRVGLTGAPSPGMDLIRAAEQVLALGERAEQLDRSVLASILAIEDHASREGVHLLALHDGIRVTLGASDIYARSPDPELLTRFWKDSSHAIPSLANEISCVIELIHGAARVVLGADLPFHASDGRTVVDSGWNLVLQRHGHLIEHSVFKIPHHGSRGALHPQIIKPGTTERTWALSPFNSSFLPRSDEGDGLDLLLGAQEPLHLTSLSTSTKLAAAFARSAITREDLARATKAIRSGEQFQHGDTVVRAATALGALDPVWCFALNAEGHVIGRWAGSAALEVFRTDPSTSADGLQTGTAAASDPAD